jgi:UDP-N-acetylmuramate dehydrogenase
MHKDHIFLQLKTSFPEVQRDVSLKDHTTFKIGGLAEYFLVAKTKEEVIEAIKIAKTLGLAVFVFGGGSNLLISDNGISGLVIKIENVDGILVKDNFITAPAGVSMEAIVNASLDASLEGLEWAGGLPGSFGGAVRGNAGAFGGEIKDVVVSVEALNDQLELKTFTNQECHFSYRNSIFKEKNWIIFSITVGLKPGNQEKLREISESRKAYRKKNHPLEYPSAGSIFKNVAVEKIPAEFQAEFASKIKQDPFPIVPAAWFIIGAGLTGTMVGQAQISDKHSNYIVNIGGAKASDVLALIKLAQEEVKRKYKIELEVEVQFVGN